MVRAYLGHLDRSGGLHMAFAPPSFSPSLERVRPLPPLTLAPFSAHDPYLPRTRFACPNLLALPTPPIASLDIPPADCPNRAAAVGLVQVSDCGVPAQRRGALVAPAPPRQLPETRLQPLHCPWGNARL
jgi:hypothetical protein